MSEPIRYTFSSTAFATDPFTVARFSGEEAISSLYRFSIDLVADDPGIDTDDLLGEDATFTIHSGTRRRMIHGIVSNVETLSQVNGRAIARVILHPRVWNLTRATANAVHLDTATPDIIRNTLTEIGITDTDHERDLIGDYRPWPFRLQYGETHWQFLLRILERDGVYYYFEPGREQERIVFCDHQRNQPAVDDNDISFVQALGMDPGDRGEAVHALVAESQHPPARVVLRNYNDERPSHAISAEETIDPKGSGTIDIFGENVLDQEEARRLVAIRAEEIRCQQRTVHGASTVARLAAGHQFRLTRHPRDQANQEYLLLRVEHQGEDPQVLRQIGQSPEHDEPTYENRFTAMPADIQYRPPRDTVKPRIHGHLNARIDASGDNPWFAEMDEQGRYHVVFPFDTAHDAGKASHWIRLMQPYAGEREGMHFPLRKGARVLVGFIGGDPDLPVIGGTIPNTEQPSVTNADNFAKSNIRTASGNFVEIDDDHPRIKFYSPTCRTYMHLGASNNPAEGVVSVTDGLSQWTSLGAVNMTFATQGWLVESDIWPTPTSDERNIQLQWYTLNEAAARESESEWTVDDTIERMFRFPLKHERPDSADLKYRLYHDDANMGTDPDYVTRDDELSNLLHTSRKLGEEYSYRSGTDFAFNGPQREAFTFGPMASLDSYSHDADPNDLRAAIRDVLQEFGEEDAWDDLGNTEIQDYQDARVDYRVARETRIRKEALLLWNRDVEIDEDKDSSGNKNNRSLKDRFEDDFFDNANRATLIRIAVTAAGEDIDNELGNLRSDVESKLDNDGNGDAKDALTDDMLGIIYTSDIADRLNHTDNVDNGTGAPGDFESWFEDVGEDSDGNNVTLDFGSQNAGNEEDYLIALIAEHATARKTYNDAWELVRDEKDADLVSRLRRGRLSVSDLTQVSIHNGESISYTRGASYSETHIRDIGGSASIGSNTIGFADKGLDKDHVENIGPKFGSISSEVSAYDPDNNNFDGDWNQGNVNVTKTIGNTYSFQKGSSISVAHGNSQSIKKIDKEFTKVINNDNGKVILERDWKPDSLEETQKHPDSGAITRYESGYWDAGWNSFVFEFAPKANLTINASFRIQPTINLGATADINVHIGSFTKCDLPLINYNELKVGAGFITEVIACAGRVNVTQGTVTSNFPGIKSDLSVNDLNNKINDLEQTTAAKLKKAGMALNQAGMKVEGTTGLRLSQAGLTMMV